jgi:hypothetical protein
VNPHKFIHAIVCIGKRLAVALANKKAAARVGTQTAALALIPLSRGAAVVRGYSAA